MLLCQFSELIQTSTLSKIRSLHGSQQYRFSMSLVLRLFNFFFFLLFRLVADKIMQLRIGRCGPGVPKSGGDGGIYPRIIWLYTPQQFVYGLYPHPLQYYDSGVHLSSGL